MVGEGRGRAGSGYSCKSRQLVAEGGKGRRTVHARIRARVDVPSSALAGRVEAAARDALWRAHRATPLMFRGSSVLPLHLAAQAVQNLAARKWQYFVEVGTRAVKVGESAGSAATRAWRRKSIIARGALKGPDRLCLEARRPPRVLKW